MPLLTAPFSLGRRSFRLSKRVKKWTLPGPGLLFIILVLLLMFNFIITCLLYLLSITDSFVNSQEWTISRSVPNLRLVS